MPLNTINNGDSGLQARTKINAAIAAVNAGGGSLTNEVWVDPSAGNDATGQAGSAARPFATLQAAYNAGATILHVGQGDAGSLHIDSNAAVSLLGVGRDKSVIPLIGCNSGFQGGTIRGNGIDNITVGQISLASDHGTNGTAGMSLGNIYISGLNVSGNIEVTAGSGGNGANGADENLSADDPSTPPTDGGNGGHGADGAALYITDCAVDGDCITTPGTGGKGGNAGSTYGDTAGANGGSGGNGGGAGSITLSHSRARKLSAPAASGGAGGTASNGTTTGINGDAGLDGSPGTVSARWSEIDQDAADGETTSYRFSSVADTWNA